MKVVGNKLAEWADSCHEFSDKDRFCRSAFNRYYYSAFLLTREMLREFDSKWEKTAACQDSWRAFRRSKAEGCTELEKAVENRLMSSDERDEYQRKLTVYLEGLASLLQEANEIRVVADYKPEELTIIEDNELLLNGCNVANASRWPDRASTYCNSIRGVWSAPALPDADEIKAYLDQGKRWYVRDVQIRASDDTILLYVPRDVVASKVSKGFTSVRQLNNLASHLCDTYSSDVVIIQTESDRHQKIEALLFDTLNFRFEGQIVSLFISCNKEAMADIWIEIDAVEGQLYGDIEKHLDKLLPNFDLSLGHIEWLSSPSSMPTMPALLRQVKAHQPISQKTSFLS